MIKSTPNSNLLTVADSPFQHHLIYIAFVLYIYREIQMVLDSPNHTKEESLAYNPVRSVPFSTTLCVPFRAVWRRKRGHEADGRGNVLAGGERGGKSHITYKPYGEILRTDSYGPDISKYKYTGQEEDRESGLMYYKARYYDAKIGRFLQQDSMAFPNQVNGMNRMMYVEGNPVRYTDSSGNSTNYGHMLGQIVKHMTGGFKIADHSFKSLTKGAGYSMRKAGRGIDGAARQLASGGKHSRNKGNDIDHLLGTGSTFAGIQNSNLGDWITKQYNDIRTKPFELNDKRALRKTEDKHKVRSLACAAYFGFGTSGFADCFIRSYAMRTKQRTDIKKKSRWYPGEDYATGDDLVELGESEYVKRELLITYYFKCGIPSAISTPHCPSKQETENDKGDNEDK